MMEECPWCDQPISANQKNCGCGWVRPVARRIQMNAPEKRAGEVHPGVLKNLEKMGLVQQPGETALQFAKRCQQWIVDNNLMSAEGVRKAMEAAFRRKLRLEKK